MKNSIISTGGQYSTARMLVDYTNKLYMPLCNLTKKYYSDLNRVTEFDAWKANMYSNWKDIQIEQVENNADNITVDAGAEIEVRCAVTLPNIEPESVRVEVYYGKFLENGTVQDVQIIPMRMEGKEEENRKYYYVAKIKLTTGGNYGYSFRVMPQNEMILDSENMDLVKWIEK